MVGKAEELAEIDALFARADADHDGQINFSEFQRLVWSSMPTASPPRVCASASRRPTPTAMAASTSMSSARGG